MSSKNLAKTHRMLPALPIYLLMSAQQKFSGSDEHNFYQYDKFAEKFPVLSTEQITWGLIFLVFVFFNTPVITYLVAKMAIFHAPCPTKTPPVEGLYFKIRLPGRAPPH